MAEALHLHRPWLVAVWPGMGHVAISAGYYLMAKLGMELFAEISARDLFDVDDVDVKEGLVQAGRLPRSRFFVWRDPEQRHDLILFIGEAQPPLGKYTFCQRLIQSARDWDVERVLTFAAMATPMNPDAPSRVFCAATSRELLQAVREVGSQTVDEGRIGGLNGILLAAAVEAGMEGACLLGEMPHVFAQLPFPKASLAVLRTFCKLSGIELDLSELERQAEAVSEQLGELLSQIEAKLSLQQGEKPEEEDEYGLLNPEEEGLSAEDKQRIETLFAESKQNRSKAYELKRELDRLEVFKEYENRFLDLFKK